jgi:hypothetical protein
MDIKKELQARLDFIKDKLKHEKVVDTKPYRVYFRGFTAGRIRGYMAEIYFLEGLIMALDGM